VQIPPAALEEVHPRLAARDEHRPEPEPPHDLPPDPRDLGAAALVELVRILDPNGASRLVMVRRDDIEIPVHGEIVALGVHAYGDPAALDGPADPVQEPFRHDPLVVIGDHDGLQPAEDGLDIPDDAVGALGPDPVPALPVVSDHLLPVGDDPRLDRRGPLAFLDEPARVDVHLLQPRLQPVPHPVGADDPRNGDVASHGVDVAHHVAGAAHHEVFLRHLDDGDRRLGRDPGDLAPDEMIHHEIADDEHPRGGVFPDDLQGPPAADGPLRRSIHCLLHP